MGVSGNLATEERLAWVRARLEEHGRVRIAEAARELGVSEMTVRRDLQELESLGYARRVRGGAVSIAPLSAAETRNQVRTFTRIATKAAALVPDVGAVGLDGSAAGCRLAAGLEMARDLIVVTNGLDTFQVLHDRPGITPLLTGGRLDVRTGSLVGPLAVASAGQVLLRLLVISASAIDPELGPSEPSMEEAEVKRAMAAVADTVVLAVDSSVLGGRAMAVSVPWERIDTLVTELDPADARLDPFRDKVALL
jgi:DeoR family fructose operon transcriptional repressor